VVILAAAPLVAAPGPLRMGLPDLLGTLAAGHSMPWGPWFGALRQALVGVEVAGVGGCGVALALVGFAVGLGCRGRAANHGQIRL